MLLVPEALTQEIARVHRIKPRLTNAESVARGAVLIRQLAGTPEMETTSAAALLLRPPLAGLTRQPLHVAAKLDLTLGGSGFPVLPEKLQVLGAILSHDPRNGVGADILGLTYGALDNGLAVGLILARLAAMAFGLDPKGLCVPEVYFTRYRSQLFDALSSYDSDPEKLYEVYVKAMYAGAAEAEGIARQ